MPSTNPYVALVDAIAGHSDHAPTFFRSILPPSVADLLDLTRGTRCTLPPAHTAPRSGARAARPSRTSRALHVTTRRHGGRRQSHEEMPQDSPTITRGANEEPTPYLFIRRMHTVDPATVLHILERVTRIWDEWKLTSPNAQDVPMVFAVVLYHGTQEWNAPIHLSDILDTTRLGLAEHKELSPYLNNLRIHFVDVARTPDAELAEPGIVRLTLLLLKHAKDPALTTRFGAWAEDILEVASRGGPGLKELNTLVEFIKESRPDLSVAACRDLLAPLGEARREWVLAMGSQVFHSDRSPRSCVRLDESVN